MVAMSKEVFWTQKLNVFLYSCQDWWLHVTSVAITDGFELLRSYFANKFYHGNNATIKTITWYIDVLALKRYDHVCCLESF